MSKTKRLPRGANEWQIKQAWADAQNISAGDRRRGSWRAIDRAAKLARERVAQREPRPLIQHFRVRVLRDPPLERIIVTRRGERGGSWLTIQDAEYLIGQLQRAIKRAPKAR